MLDLVRYFYLPGLPKRMAINSGQKDVEVFCVPDEGLSPKRLIINFFSLNLHISHLDH